MVNNESVRGTVSWAASETTGINAVISGLHDLFATHAYEKVTIPILEYTELFSSKSGEDIISKMFAFQFRGRDICLRPEFTAPIAKYYIHHGKSLPLPQRYSYDGPVFRYERPGAGRYREFTQLGVELIGPLGSLADAEVIALAEAGLEHIGLTNYKLQIGHLKAVTELLRPFELNKRCTDFVLASMQDLAKPERGLNYVLDRIDELFGSSDSQLPEVIISEPDNTLAIIRVLLDEMQVRVGAGRDPEEIAERILAKLSASQQGPKIREAIMMINELREIQGSPPYVFRDLRSFLIGREIDTSVVDELEQLIELLSCYGLDASKTCINLGLGRGLQYYTGVVFELYADVLGTESQICGGGRYDELIGLLSGGPTLPACGFAYGIERLWLVLQQNGQPATKSRFSVLVVPLGLPSQGYAIRVAEALRQQGIRTELDPAHQTPRSGLRHANNVGARICILVGEQEQTRNVVAVRDMTEHQQYELAMEEAISFCLRTRGEG